MKVVELPSAPVMMVAVFCGTSKPTSLEAYLRPLITEANELQQRGLQIAGRVLQLKITGVIADSPARSFLKGMDAAGMTRDILPDDDDGIIMAEVWMMLQRSGMVI